MSNSAGHVRTLKNVHRRAEHLNPSIISPFTAPPPALRLLVTGAYFSCSSSETRMSRLRNFDTEPPSSYCYELQPDHRLESIANARTAADLHVRPWFSNRADRRAEGRCERINSYIMSFFPQQ
jgi:hypothetical protein